MSQSGQIKWLQTDQLRHLEIALPVACAGAGHARQG